MTGLRWPACGQDSRGELPYRPASFLAERLGMELPHFQAGTPA